MIKIICDSMSDIPKEYIDKFNIHIVPTSATLDEVEYLDGVDITSEEFMKLLKNSKEFPKTSQATYGRFLEVFEKYAKEYKEIIYIGSSSKASGTYQSGVMAINDIKSDCQIHHIDTLNFSAGGGVFAIKACLLLQEGLSAKEIVNKLEELKGNQRVCLTVDDLNYLKKGGRISATKAFVGTLLNIKPLIALEEGTLVPKGQARGKKQIISELLKYITNNIDDIENKIIIYGCGENKEDLDTIKNKISKAGFKHIYQVEPGITTISHTGPSLIGIAIL